MILANFTRKSCVLFIEEMRFELPDGAEDMALVIAHGTYMTKAGMIRIYNFSKLESY
jgi:hypothetical protein